MPLLHVNCLLNGDFTRETVEVYLTNLCKISMSFGGVNGQLLGCAYLAGLPEDVSKLLRASSKMDELPTDQLLA